MKNFVALLLVSFCFSCVGEPIPDCETDNGGCDDLTTCTASDEGVSCGDCPSGFTGTGETGCEDTDECETDNGGCDALTTCTNRGGGAGRTCGDCPDGYDGDGETGCSDINECLVDNGGCDALTTCTNRGGGAGRTCGDCPDGYDGDGETGCELCAGCCFEASTDCRANEVCRDSNASFGACTGADGISYTMVVGNLEVCDRKTTGESWDASGGAPDLKIRIDVNGTAVFTSRVEQDRYTAFVNSDSVVYQTNLRTTDTITVYVIDEDNISDDLVGGFCVGGCDTAVGIEGLRGTYYQELNLGSCDVSSVSSVDFLLFPTSN